MVSRVVADGEHRPPTAGVIAASALALRAVWGVAADVVKWSRVTKFANLNADTNGLRD
jgi:hypothetical protein